MRLSAVVKKIQRKEKRMRIVILGADNAGKTTLLHAFLGKPVRNISPTFGYQLIREQYKVPGSSREYALEIFDMGGQESIRSYWETHYAGADGVLFVYDNTTRGVNSELLKRALAHPTLRNASFICAANKTEDIPEQSNREVKVLVPKEETGSSHAWKLTESTSEETAQDSGSLEEIRSVPIIYTSGTTGRNVTLCFKTLVESIEKKRKQCHTVPGA